MDNKLLTIDKLSVEISTRSGTVYPVNGVSYELARGEILGIVGESGSGKSVHTLAISGLLPRPQARVSQGKILFNGENLLQHSDKALRRIRGCEIGHVFQDPMTSLNPMMTIGAQICEALKENLGLSGKEAKARAQTILETVEIPNAQRRLQEYPHQLSGGLRQRVGIALGICCEPKLLIADEPTTALDVSIQAQILELIARLCKEMDMAVILITHDLAVVSGMADQTAVMYGGKIMEIGPTKEVFSNTHSAYTLGLLRSQPVFAQGPRTRLVPIAGTPPNLRQVPLGDPFAPRNPFASARDMDECPPLRPVKNGHPEHKVAAWYDLPRAFCQQITEAGGPMHPTDLNQRYFPSQLLSEFAPQLSSGGQE